MSTEKLTPQVLVIGLDPQLMAGGFDPEPVARAIEQGMGKLAERGVVAQSCLFGPDDDVDRLVTEALRGHAWECVVIGVGLRKADAELELFERIVNLARVHAPAAAIAFNATIPDFYEAASRWIGAPA